VTQVQEPTKERCGVCRFYLHNKDSNPKDPTGLCRRFPPTVTSGSEDYVWPLISDLDWCGEFRPLGG